MDYQYGGGLVRGFKDELLLKRDSGVMYTLLSIGIGPDVSAVLCTFNMTRWLTPPLPLNLAGPVQNHLLHRGQLAR